MIISLTGFMGCGKSSIGRQLCELTGCDYIDLDLYIEQKSGKSISCIFAENGEQAFREMEKSALEEIIGSRRNLEKMLLLSLGGGTVTSGECASMVKENTVCFYLRASIETLMKNLENDFESRPMLNTGNEGDRRERLRARIMELMETRKSIYENTAHVIIDIDSRSFRDIALEIRDIATGNPPCRVCP